MNGHGVHPADRENDMTGDTPQRLRRTDQQQGMAMNGMPAQNNSLRGMMGQRSLSGAGVGRSLVGTGTLSDSQNPYSMYGESESLDDGIHEDLTSRTIGLNKGTVSSDLPREDEIRREFIDYMDAMSPMSEPEEVALRNTDVEEKWNLIRNQKQRSPIFNIRYYIENLRQNQGTRRKKFSLGRSSSKSGVSPLTYLLRKLKVDLMMSSPSFLEEFSEPPNGGVHLLVHLLRSMQVDQNSLQTSRKTRMDEYKKLLEDETDCLFCLKFLTRTEEGRLKLARQEGIFDLIAQSTLCSKSKSRAISLQLLGSLCRASSTGYQHTMQAMSKLQQRLQEPVIFRTLCTTLNSADGEADISFMVATVHFFNTLVACVSNANASVHLQYELERAGFNPDQFDKHSYGESVEQEDLGRELDNWRKNYINVVSTREQISGLDNRNTVLREEVTRLQEQIKAVEKMARHKEREKRRMSEKRDDYRERAAELQDTVAKLTKLYAESTGNAASDVNVEEVLKPLDTPSSSKDKFDTVRSISSVADEIDICVPRAPPLPPPAPPMQPPRRKFTACASVDLPMLNWTPIQTVTNTIFQDLDDEHVYNQIDFADFESRFKLQRRQETAESQERRQRIAVKHQTNKLLFVNLNRARNLCITKHRTGLTSRQIREAIESCEVAVLPGENAELLIKFIPTKDELKMLAQHREEYWKMGEAEQFLFQLAQVERLESKLSLLAFIGIFDELIQSVRPNIARVLDASNSVATNQGLKRIFEIILAFGNYMNGAKRGYTMGFKLESLYKLSDVKTVDRQQTLMHFLAEQVAAKYPESLTFYDGVNLAVTKGASFHSMHQDVKGLRKGLDLVKFEKEKQANNPVLERFYADASEQVTNVAESFKKMEETYKEVCLTFGENYKHIEPDVFFGTLADFANNFKTARQENLMKATRLIGSSPPKPKAISTLPTNSKTSRKSSAESSSSVSKQSAPTTKKEAPKILASLAPQASPLLKPQAARKDLPRGGTSGPMAAQHGVMAPVTSQKVKQTSPGGVQQKPTGSIKKKVAPAAPSINTAPGAPLTNGVPEATTDKQAENKSARPQILQKPERARAPSEPSTADFLAAVDKLDQIVDDEERYGGIPEQETYTSYL